MTPGDHDDPFADVAVTVASIKRDTLRIRELALGLVELDRLAERTGALPVAQRICARQRVRAGVAASAASAMLMASLTATMVGVSLPGTIVTGLLAGIGSGLPGLVLILRPDLLDRMHDRIDGWRR